jgi:hypothetical protein
MDEYLETEFWDMIYQEYGVEDELDILSENISEIIMPIKGIIILITKDYNDGKETF